MSTTTRRNLGTFLLLILGFIIIYKAMNINEVIFFDEFTPKNYYMRPDNFEETCKLDKNCGTECDVCCELPYHVDTGNFFNPTPVGRGRFPPPLPKNGNNYQK